MGWGSAEGHRAARCRGAGQRNPRPENPAGSGPHAGRRRHGQTQPVGLVPRPGRSPCSVRAVRHADAASRSVRAASAQGLRRAGATGPVERGRGKRGVSPPLFCARRTPAKPRQSRHSGSFLRSHLSHLSKSYEITEITETTETTDADLRKRQSSQSSQLSQWARALSRCHGKTSPPPVTLRHQPQCASCRERRTKRAKGIGATKGMRTREARVLARPTRSGGLRLPWSRPVVSVVSVVSVDSVSTEMTGLLPRRNVRFVRVAVRGVGLP